jgi:chemotaxis protein histidine kinase CheA
VWGKLPRVVRDLAVACGKQVGVRMEGEDTELDKTILEAIKDPLTHLVRNAVDHGIETAAERTAAGKAAEGTLSLRAFHEGGQVNIEIADDGAGIDARRMLAKAVERGLVPREAAEGLGEREILSLVFAPGFSTTTGRQRPYASATWSSRRSAALPSAWSRPPWPGRSWRPARSPGTSRSSSARSSTSSPSC